MFSRFLTCVVWLPWRGHFAAASGATVTLGLGAARVHTEDRCAKKDLPVPLCDPLSLFLASSFLL